MNGDDEPGTTVDKHLSINIQTDEDLAATTNSSSIHFSPDESNQIDDFEQSSDDEFIEERIRNVTSSFDSNSCLKDELARWGVRSGVTRDHLTNLLKILRQHNNPDLPADSRTLLQTPLDVDIRELAGGGFVYLGIEVGLGRLSNEMIV